jgi:Uma2 family endonuclease
MLSLDCQIRRCSRFDNLLRAYEIRHVLDNVPVLPQLQWSEQEYLALTTNRIVEFSHGKVEMLPPPTQRHQFIVALLYRFLSAFAATHDLGTVLFAGLRVRLWPGKFREPDVVFMAKVHDCQRHDDYWEGADLVMEVVSSNRDLDLVKKRREYAQAGIPEYWIVDMEQETISVLYLDGDHYRTHGAFGRTDKAASATLIGFEVSVDEVFSQK